MMEQHSEEYFPLLVESYTTAVQAYPIEVPEIASGSTYYFNTESGLRYEVLFAKKRENYLENIINFSVLNEEFEDEYSETNRGEVYRVISTVIEIIRIYHEHHAYSISYEFSGEFKEGNEQREYSIRTLLYYRKAKQILHPLWHPYLENNKVIISRKPR